MIKTVQVEQKRMICDICEQNYHIIHTSSEKLPDCWVRINVNAVKTFDICPSCAANKLAMIDWEKYKQDVING